MSFAENPKSIATIFSCPKSPSRRVHTLIYTAHISAQYRANKCTRPHRSPHTRHVSIRLCAAARERSSPSCACCVLQTLARFIVPRSAGTAVVPRRLRVSSARSVRARSRSTSRSTARRWRAKSCAGLDRVAQLFE